MSEPIDYNNLELSSCYEDDPRFYELDKADLIRELTDAEERVRKLVRILTAFDTRIEILTGTTTEGEPE